MIRKVPGYIKTRFSPTELVEWYNSPPSDLSELSELSDEIVVDLSDTESDKSDKSEVFDQSDKESDSDNSDYDDFNVNKNITKNVGYRNNTTWRKQVVNRYKRCVVSGVDAIECDAAHIVPFHACKGKKLGWGTDKINGLLLSKNLHWTFDRLYWSLDPNDIIDDENKRKVWIRIVTRGCKKRLTILDYYYTKTMVQDQNKEKDQEDHQQNGNKKGYILIYRDSLEYVRYHYNMFLEFCNKYEKKMKTMIDQVVNEPMPIVRIIKKKFNASNDEIYHCLEKNSIFNAGRWLTIQEGNDIYGEKEFEEALKKFQREVECREDPDYK